MRLFYEDFRYRKEIFNLLDCKIYRQNHVEKYYGKFGFWGTEVYTLIHNNNTESPVCVFLFDVLEFNGYIKNIMKISLCFNNNEGEQEYYRYIILCFLQKYSEVFIITDSKYSQLIASKFAIPDKI